MIPVYLNRSSLNMKAYFTFLIFIFSLTNTVANSITATVVFENLTDKTSITGVFFITETNQSFQIDSLKNFTIELPDKGKYQFGFYSDQINASTYYPVRITENKNVITIRLEDKKKNQHSYTTKKVLPPTKTYELSFEQIEKGIENGTINFIIHGLVALSPSAFEAFKNDYGVGFISQNCVLDPTTFNKTMNNNKSIAKYLTSKYGNVWKSKLPTQPFGMK